MHRNTKKYLLWMRVFAVLTVNCGREEKRERKKRVGPH